MFSGKISILTGAAFFAASAFAQVPTRDVNLQSGQPAGQSANFNLQILEEVDALRREITELRETIDQQRFETERLRRENAQSIATLERELNFRTAPPAMEGVDGGFTGEPGAESGAFAVGGGGAGEPGYDGGTSAPPVGSAADTGTIDEGTEAILSNLYDGGAAETAAGGALSATNAGAGPGDSSAPEQAQLRAEQAQFRAEQAQLLEAQAQFLQEQARFRQEQARFLQEQAGGAVAPGAGAPSSGQMPAQQPAQPQVQQPVQPQGQSTMPPPSQGAIVPPARDDAAGADIMIGPAAIVPEPISMDQDYETAPPRGNANDIVVPSTAPVATPSEPSLEMVIIDNEPAVVAGATSVSDQNKLVNPFDLDEAPTTSLDVSVSGGVYSSTLDDTRPPSDFSAVETDGSALLAQRSIVTTQPNTILEVDIPQPQKDSDSATTIAPNAIGTSAPQSAESFGFSTPDSGTAFGPELAQNTPGTQGGPKFVIEDNAGEEVVLAAEDAESFVADNDFNTGQVPADAPPEPVPELPSRQDPEPQVVVLTSPESPPPFTPAALPQRESEPEISPNREPEPEVVLLTVPGSPPSMAQPVDSPPPMTQGATYASSTPAAQVATVQKAPDNPVSVNSGEALLYNEAFAFYQNGKYSKAIKGFKKQLKEFPNGTLAADAHYWSGEALFVTRSMVPAQQHMETILLEYGGSARAPDAMLKLAIIRKGQGQKDDASRIYRELIERFPGTQAAMAAQTNLASNR